MKEIKKIDFFLNCLNFFIFTIIFIFLGKFAQILGVEDDSLFGLGSLEGIYSLAYLLNTLIFRENIQLQSLKNQSFMYQISGLRIFNFIFIMPFLTQKYGFNGFAFFYLIDYTSNFILTNFLFLKRFGWIKLNIFLNMPFMIIILLMIIININMI